MNILMLLGQYRDYRENPKLNGAIDHLLDALGRRGQPLRVRGGETL